jgi:tRNA dimethylallyltransferase
MSKPKVIAIVGPTASGKTTLSITLAKVFSGEVISADSRQVYRGMDLGTGKVTLAEMANIPHHLIDICDPSTIYTATHFVKNARAAITDITDRQKLPIIAGGTFFYLDLLKGRHSAPAVAPNPQLRLKLEAYDLKKLVLTLTQLDPVRAAQIDTQNPRRLIRAIEIATALGIVPVSIPTESPYQFLTLGIEISLAELTLRIRDRVFSRLNEGMIEEVETLHHQGISWTRLDSFGLEYRYLAQYLQNQIDRETMITEIVTKSRQFAKRQKTWLKRDPTIIWLPFPADVDRANKLVTEFINKL